jgi:nucleotide-binding universal stress UspA family protein
MTSFSKILVPLDGSALGEEVVVVAGDMAARLGSQVTLLHVLERDAPSSVHGQRHITDPNEGISYLQEVASRLIESGVQVETHVHPRGVGSVAAAIDAHAHEYGADLIAMCKHGHSGLRDRIVGSIAQQILKGGAIPILLRTPTGDAPSSFSPQRILAPLDFEHDVDPVFDAAALVADAFDATVLLITSVPTPIAARRGSVAARFRPSATAASLEIEAEEAIAQLKTLGSQLAARGVRVELDIGYDDPADAIVHAARSEGVELVVLSTHARAGMETWLEEGVGGRVIAAGPGNLLLLREL